MNLFLFLVSLALSMFLTPIVRLLMRRFKIVDEPKVADRKIHRNKIALGGGVAVFISFFIVIFLWSQLGGMAGRDITLKNLCGLFVGGLILMAGGILDDKYRLRPRQQVWFPVLAAFVVIAFGIGPEVITNPLGGVFRLDLWRVPIDGLGNFVVLADLLVFCWLMGMMYTTKLLDGLDGLVSGVVAIGAIMIGFLCLRTEWHQPEVALVSFVFAGACVGFLFWNWHPAKIFLGEGGSLFLGFMLGSLAIISGGKIATALLVMGVPVLDVARVILTRVRRGRPLYVGDNEHLHFRLLKSGLSHKQVVLLLYSISFLFGISALFLQTSQKLIALLFLFVLMMLVGVWFSQHRV